MTAPVTIHLLGEPVGFARMRLGRTGQHFVPAHQRNHAAALRLAAEYAMRDLGAQLFDEPLHVELVAECGIPASWSKKKKAAALAGLVRPGRPDLDNVFKLVADAFNSIVWRDDALVVELVASKRYGAQPKIVALVRPARTYDEAADLAGSYTAAVEELGRRVKAGTPVPDFMLPQKERR